MDVAPRSTSTIPIPWKVGVQLAHQKMEYDGGLPRPHPFYATPTRLVVGHQMTWGTAWGDFRFSRGPVEIQPGIRIEIEGSGNSSTGSLRLAPRFAASVTATDRLSISIGYSRGYQRIQHLSEAGAVWGYNYPLSRLWLMAGDTLDVGEIPVLRTDVTTAGVEYWLYGSWLLSATTYMRWDRGLVVPDPTPGEWSDRPLYVVGEGSSRGIELSLRRMTGRLTTMVAYSRARARIQAAGWNYPAPGE